VMPSNYEALISKAELDELVEFLADSTAKGGGSK
jgi:hypothetical protein